MLELFILFIIVFLAYKVAKPLGDFLMPVFAFILACYVGVALLGVVVETLHALIS